MVNRRALKQREFIIIWEGGSLPDTAVLWIVLLSTDDRMYVTINLDAAIILEPDTAAANPI